MSNSVNLQVMLKAEEIVRNYIISAFPVNLTTITNDLGIVVMAKPTNIAGVSGMFLRLGEEFGIAYATHIDSIGFQRFSIAHELGHYFLPDHIKAVLADGDIHESRAGFTSANHYEREADYFAASLLMPRSLFVPAIRTAGDGIAAIKSLSDLSETSLVSTAIRYAQCTDNPVAIIVSRGNLIDYCFMSDALKELNGIDWLRKRESVPRNTPTFTFNKDDNNVRCAKSIEGTADIQTWFGGHCSIELSEDVIGLGRYGKTLTLLYNIEIPDAEDEDDEKSLIESLTPRFRR